MNFVKEYNVENLHGMTEEEFNEKVEFNISLGADLIPYDDPNYTDNLIRTAIAAVHTEYDPEFIKMCEEHDKWMEEHSEDEVGSLEDILPF